MLLCCTLQVARKDDKPVGFAIVEFTDGATAECTRQKLKNLMIEGQQVELEMCVPGQTVPEAFTRQMSLLVIPLVFVIFGAFVLVLYLHMCHYRVQTLLCFRTIYLSVQNLKASESAKVNRLVHRG